MQVQYKLIDDDDDYTELELYRGSGGTYIRASTSPVFIPDSLYELFIEHIGRLNGEID